MVRILREGDMNNKKIKRIIAREGLIFLFWLGINFIIRSCLALTSVSPIFINIFQLFRLYNPFISICFIYLPIRVVIIVIRYKYWKMNFKKNILKDIIIILFIAVSAYIANWLGTKSYFMILLLVTIYSYPVYLFIRFIVWAVTTLKERK